MRVSVVQMDVRTRDVRANMDRAYAGVREAARRQSEVVLLPEMWSTGFAYPDLREIAGNVHRETLRFMTEIAREHRIRLLGTVPEPGSDGVYNTLYWISPSGEIEGEYRKAHLFTPTGEGEHFRAGSTCDVVRTDLGVFGGLICFDIRFPEMARLLALRGALVLFVAAQFPHPRADHWETLLRARAIENQVWVVAANRVGRSGSLEYFGRSMVIDPWGKVTEGDEAERECIVTADLDLEYVSHVRSRLPCERRPDIYGDFQGAMHPR